jgi:transposase, IS5 family
LVTVDTTVHPQLLRAAIKGQIRLARKHGVRLRQSYQRIAKRAAVMAGRYAHAMQFNRPTENSAPCACGSAGLPATLPA